MIRRTLLSLLATIALLLGGASIAEAAPLKPLYLAKSTISTGVTDYPVPVCDYNFFSCGYVSVEATFAGLNRASWRPTGSDGLDALLNGTVDISRQYGCADSTGKRLRAPLDQDTGQSRSRQCLQDRSRRELPSGRRQSEDFNARRHSGR